MLKALNYNVIGISIIEKETPSGIITSANEELQPMKMQVVSIGSQVKADIKSGDVVIFPKFKDAEVKHEEEKYSVVHCDVIKAILKDD